MKTLPSLALMGLTSALTAQGAPIQLGTDDARGLNRDSSGRLFAAGADFEAELGPERVRFVPGLRGGEREHALSFELESAQVGGVSLPLQRGTEPAAHDLTAVYDRGSFLERYEVLHEGLEQSFVFDELPARGDLVVHGRIQTGLELVFSDPVLGLAFEDGPLGGVTIGGVTGIDADGRSASGWITLDGDRLELGLPASFVETAELPLVLDPIIGSVIGLATTSLDDRAPDVAAYASTHLVVWEWHASGNTSIRARKYDDSGNPITNVVTVSGGSDDRNPSVGILSGFGRFVVAWEHEDAANDTYIEVAFVDYFGVPTVSPAVEISVTGTDVTPDVGMSIGSCPVVWKDKFGIRVTDITDDGTGKPKDGGPLDLSNNEDDHSPAVTSNWTGINYHMAVWQRDPGSGTDSIVGRRWNWAVPPGLWDLEFTIASGSADPGAPDVARAANDDYFVVWEQDETVGSDRDVVARRVLYPTSTPRLGPIVDIEADSNDDEHSPAIAYATNQYVVAFLDGSGGGTSFVDGRAIDPMTGAVIEVLNNLAGTNNTYGAPAVACSSTNTNSLLDEPMLVWDEPSGSDMDLRGRVVEGIGGLNSPEPLTSCGIFPGESRVSAATVGNSLRHEMWYGEPGAPVYIIIGAPQVNVPFGAGGVIVPFPLVIQFIGISDFDGYASFDSPVDPSLAGLTIWEQWLILSAGGSCDPAGWSLADGVEITFE